MLGLKVKTNPIRDKRTGRFVSTRAFKSLSHAAASIAKDMKASIKRSPNPSTPGQPPHTRFGLIKKAIRYFVDKATMTAVIGPRASEIDEAAKVHEFGGTYKGEDYPARPFALPALERAEPRFAGEFTGMIGE